MLTTKRLLLGIVMLGVVGMHGLAATGGTPAAHHVWATTTAAASARAADHVHTSTTPADDEGATALALCMALLLALAGAVRAGRRTTWVAQLDRGSPPLPLPFPPVLRDRSPVPRFTVMRC
ncbi:MAG TPA: DUF6153 family protein [Nocardioidaceae bacterium]|nr:DUF6153 family protein [Nocardioidaceae bacterium]